MSEWFVETMKTPSIMICWLLLALFFQAEANAREAVKVPLPLKLEVKWTVKANFSAVTLSILNRGNRPIKVWPILDFDAVNDPRLKTGSGMWENWAASEHAVLPTVRFLDREGHLIDLITFPVNMPVPAAEEIAAGATGKIRLLVGVGADFKDAARKAQKIVLAIAYRSKEICRVTMHKSFGRWVQDS